MELAESRPPRLSSGRLICVDGPAGSGKSSLALALADHGSASVIHLEDLLAGWEGGLDAMVRALVSDVLEPLAQGRDASYRRWDWHASQFADRVPVPPVPLLVVEGVGAGSRASAAYASALVWLEAGHDLRKDRCLARDGDAFAPHWQSWARDEEQHFAREDTRQRSDLVIVTEPAS